MAITISADDPRTIRAIEIAAGADRWLKWRSPDGRQEGYGVPSQTNPGHHYVVTESSCDCADFRRSLLSDLPLAEQDYEPLACKHILAVRLYTELVKAQRHAAPQQPTRQRGHLTLLAGP